VSLRDALFHAGRPDWAGGGAQSVWVRGRRSGQQLRPVRALPNRRDRKAVPESVGVAAWHPGEPPDPSKRFWRGWRTSRAAPRR